MVAVMTLGGCNGQPSAKELRPSWSRLYHDVGSLKKDADLAIRGEVIGSTQTMSDGIPFTDFTIRVDQVLHDPHNKGDLQSITVRQTGGTVDGKVIAVEGDPLLAQGEQVILFLRQYAPDRYFVLGGPSGHFRVQSGTVSTVNDKGVIFKQPQAVDAFVDEIQKA